MSIRGSEDNQDAAAVGADWTAEWLDGLIESLLSVRGSRPGKTVDLQESDLKKLCAAVRGVFMSQPILLVGVFRLLSCPVLSCGCVCACSVFFF